MLTLHIIAGFTALTVGLVAMFSPKGQRLHNTSGMIYFLAMMVISVSSTVMSLSGDRINIFLLLVGIFSFYMTFTGYRVTKIKNQKPPLLDKIVTGMMLTTLLLMVIYAVYAYTKGRTDLAIILGLFAFVSSTLAIADVQRFRKGYPNPKEWMMDHLGRMCGAYIATFTAFAVTNLTAFAPDLLLWTVPTIGGGFGIVLATKYYRKVYNIPK